MTYIAQTHHSLAHSQAITSLVKTIEDRQGIVERTPFPSIQTEQTNVPPNELASTQQVMDPSSSSTLSRSTQYTRSNDDDDGIVVILQRCIARPRSPTRDGAIPSDPAGSHRVKTPGRGLMEGHHVARSHHGCSPAGRIGIPKCKSPATRSRPG